MPADTDVTRILVNASQGNRSAVDRLMPLVYEELRRLAASRLQEERSDHTLSATALAHEAYLRLIDQNRVNWQSRAHFFAIAAKSIRRILVDHARARGRARRGGGVRPLALDEALNVAGAAPDDRLLALEDALEALAAEHPEAAEIVTLRYFGGLTVPEAAEVRGVSASTIERTWRFARAWLFDRLSEGGPAS